jgi:hypothetical protein
MKLISTILILLTLSFTSCKKIETVAETAPSNNDPNYDEHNNIFRLKASSTAPFKINIIEYHADGTTPYNSQQADQTGPFDFGFTPVVGHRISISLQSNKGAITSNVMYKGVYLDPLVIKSNGSSGSTANFEYTVTN